MDPITTAVVAALAKLSEPAVRDAYDALKALVTRKFGAGSQLERAIEAAEERPASAGRRQTLQEEVEAAHADRDEEVVARARALLQALGGEAGARTVVTQTVTGNDNMVSGTGNVTKTQHVRP